MMAAAQQPVVTRGASFTTDDRGQRAQASYRLPAPRQNDLRHVLTDFEAQAGLRSSYIEQSSGHAWSMSKAPDDDGYPELFAVERWAARKQAKRHGYALARRALYRLERSHAVVLTLVYGPRRRCDDDPKLGRGGVGTVDPSDGGPVVHRLRELYDRETWVLVPYTQEVEARRQAAVDALAERRIAEAAAVGSPEPWVRDLAEQQIRRGAHYEVTTYDVLREALLMPHGLKPAASMAFRQARDAFVRATTWQADRLLASASRAYEASLAAIKLSRSL